MLSYSIRHAYQKEDGREEVEAESTGQPPVGGDCAQIRLEPGCARLQADSAQASDYGAPRLPRRMDEIG